MAGLVGPRQGGRTTQFLCPRPGFSLLVLTARVLARLHSSALYSLFLRPSQDVAFFVVLNSYTKSQEFNDHTFHLGPFNSPGRFRLFGNGQKKFSALWPQSMKMNLARRLRTIVDFVLTVVTFLALICACGYWSVTDVLRSIFRADSRYHD